MNEFVDMHVHSKFSIDGMSTMEDYCLIAGKTGTRVICFTEHVDFNSADKGIERYNIDTDTKETIMYVKNRWYITEESSDSIERMVELTGLEFD